MSISRLALLTGSFPTGSVTSNRPDGSDTVGRHYMGHVNSVLLAVSKCSNPTVFQKTLSLNDFYFGTEDWKYPMGHISFVGKFDKDALRAGAPAIAPGFALEIMGNHSLDFWLTSEDLHWLQTPFELRNLALPDVGR